MSNGAGAPSDTDPHACPRLLSLAAHELRSPAAVVSGYLRMLQKDGATPLDERQRRMVEVAVRSCDRLAELLGELSELATIDEGLVPMQAESFDLFTDLETLSPVPPIADDRGVRLLLTGPASGAPFVGERHRLAAAFAAIAGAVMREQPAAVTIVCERRVVPDGNLACVQVAIAREADVARVWQATPGPFNEWRGGLGLRLPLARRAVERAGGCIWSPALDEAVPDGSGTGPGVRGAVVVALPLRT